jgi:hypothetical protein
MGVPLVISTLLGAEQMTPQEATVRAVYAEAVLASRMHSIMESRSPMWNSEAPDLSVAIRNVKTGPLADILDTPLVDLVTPQSGRVLDAGAGSWSTNGRHLAQVLSVNGWKPENPYVAAIQSDRKVTFSLVLDALGQQASSRKQPYTSWASFTVVLASHGEEREYKALFLFGSGEGREQAVEVLDNVFGSPTLDTLAKSNIAHDVASLPDALDAATPGASPSVSSGARKLLESVRAVPGCMMDAVTALCCDPVTGQCGIARASK